MKDSNRKIEDILAINKGLKLHVGGEEAKEGWIILNAQEKPDVDYIGDIRDLSQFPDNNFVAVYASHILEHLGHQADLPDVLNSIYRILKPKGKLFVSVPDLEILCQIFLHEQANFEDRNLVMRMMFGGQIDQYDFHYVGFNAEIMMNFLTHAGFNDFYRVPEFGIFNDTSSLRLKGVLISLNMVITK